MTKITKDNYPDTAVDNLNEIMELEKERMELKQQSRTMPNNKYRFMPKTAFDKQINMHKEHIRALKYAIGTIKRKEEKV